MNQISKNSAVNLRPGTIITGKWNKQKYYIQSRLGQGAIGSVYLARQADKTEVALKISDKAASITTEVNVLKNLAKVQGPSLGPSLFEVDDWIDRNGNCYPFYTMEYVKGEEVRPFLNKRGEEWLAVLFSQLLGDLEKLHQAGWVFGDLKIDNLIVATSPPRLRWIDVGGTTQIGRSIKEYTEFYDRGYWQIGTRKAEPGYDLFALAMVAVHYAYPKQFDRGPLPEKTLMERMRTAKSLAPHQRYLQKALQGHYRTSSEMKRDVNKCLVDGRTILLGKTSAPKVGNQRHLFWLESVIVMLIASVFWLIYYFV